MGNTNNITLFGLGPRVLSQPRIAGPALSRLNASARAAVEVLGDKGKRIRRLTTEFIRAARSNNAAQALQARQKLARLLAGLSAQEIRAIHDRARGRRMAPATDRFAPFDSEAVGRIIAGTNDTQDIRKEFGRLAAEAVEGNPSALRLLRKIARGYSPLQAGAQFIWENLERLKPLAASRDPLEFAKLAGGLVREVYDQIIEELEKGDTTTLTAAANSLGAVIDCLDEQWGQKIADWHQNKAANTWLHHKVTRLLHALSIADAQIRKDKWRPEESLPLLKFNRYGSHNLFDIIELAKAQNQLARVAKGIKIRTNIHSAGILPEERVITVLEEVLTELIANATKYADDAKAEKWIRVDWNPAERTLTVADNGIGIRDTKAIWRGGYREAPDHAPGTGKGLSYVKQQLEAVGWKIEVESTPGEGTTFTLIPPPNGMTYDQAYLQGLLAKQRTHFQTHGQFNLATLIPEVVALMTAEEQVQLAKQLFQYRYELSVAGYLAIQQLAENDWEGLKRIKKQMASSVAMTDKLFMAAQANLRVSMLMATLNSSSSQIPRGDIIPGIELAILFFQTKQKTWQEAIGEIPNPTTLKQRLLVGERGFQYNGDQGEISFDLAFYWLRSRGPISEIWEDNKWVLTFPKTCEPQKYNRQSLLNDSPWPPDPENDIVLKAYLELLGWKMTVEETPEHVVVRVDFEKG